MAKRISNYGIGWVIGLFKMTKKIVILHVIPTLEIGGAERQLSLLCTEQARQGYSVHIALRRGGQFLDLIDRKNVSIHALGDYSGLNPFLLINLNRIISVVSPMVIQTWLTQMNIVGGTAALLSKVPWIATERSNIDAYRNEPRIYNFLRTKLVRYSSGIVANSIDGMAMWQKIIPSHLVSVIGNAVDFDGISQSIEGRALIEGSNTILLVGRLTESKGFCEVVDVISSLPNDLDLKFKIIGQGPLADALLAQIERYGLVEKVQVIQDNPDWWFELANAKLLISMSKFEGTPNVVLEAAASGCPVLLSNIPAHREIFSVKSAVFVDLANSSKLINAIIDVFGNYCEALKRAENAKRIVMNMSVVEMAASYELMYKKI
jgi:glycosyltransferase involved in cell wall biosynthesis